MRRLFRGLDEMVLETAFIGVSALVFIVIAAWALNSSGATALERIPFAGRLVAGARALVDQVTG